MMDSCRVDWHDDWVCIVWTSSTWGKPELVSHWWPVAGGCGRRDHPEWADVIGLPATSSSIGSGDFSVKVGGPGLGGYWRGLRLRDGPQTQPIRTDIVPYPCPKVRKGMETRYRDGRWQKYLKTEGWVAA